MMRWVALSAFLFLSGCLGNQSLTPAQQTLLACEAWEGMFSRITAKRSAGIALQAEIDLVNQHRHKLNAICLAGAPVGTVGGLAQLEVILFQIATAGGST